MGALSLGRDDRIRTCGLFVPNEARYQTALHLDVKLSFAFQLSVINSRCTPLAVPEMRMLAARFAAFRPQRLFVLPSSATGGSRTQSPNEARPKISGRLGEWHRHSQGGGNTTWDSCSVRAAPLRYISILYQSLLIIVCHRRFVNAFSAFLLGNGEESVDKNRPLGLYLHP